MVHLRISGLSWNFGKSSEPNNHFRFYVNLGGVGMLSLTSCRWDVEISTPNLGSFYRPERPRDLVVSGVRRLVKIFHLNRNLNFTIAGFPWKNYSLEKCVSLKLPPKHNTPHQLWIKIWRTTNLPPAFPRKANPGSLKQKISRHWLRHWWKMSILGSLELCGVLESELGRVDMFLFFLYRLTLPKWKTAKLPESYRATSLERIVFQTSIW